MKKGIGTGVGEDRAGWGVRGMEGKEASRFPVDKLWQSYRKFLGDPEREFPVALRGQGYRDQERPIPTSAQGISS